jgi:hypothetical protein
MKASKKAGKKSNAAERPDGRRATVVYLQPDIMMQLKRAAMDQRRHGYEIIEDALEAWLKKPKR